MKKEKNIQSVVSDIKYSGKYIALESFLSDKVIATGKDIVDVFSRAKLKSSDPVIMFIPENDLTCIYSIDNELPQCKYMRYQSETDDFTIEISEN